MTSPDNIPNNPSGVPHHFELTPGEHRQLCTDMGEGILYEPEPQNDHEGGGGAFVLGELGSLRALEDGPLVRIHSRCFFGDVLHGASCDCGPQLDAAKEAIAHENAGILIYLYDQEGRGAGSLAKTRGYMLRETDGLDTVEAYERLQVPFDQREYGHCARFLLDHGITRVRLLSNNPRKIAALADAGIQVQQISLVAGVTENNIDYLRTKRDKAGHLFPDSL